MPVLSPPKAGFWSFSSLFLALSTHRTWNPTVAVGVEESFQPYEASLWIILSQSLDTLGSRPPATGWQGGANKAVRRVREQMLQSHCSGSYQRSLGNVNLKKAALNILPTLCGKRVALESYKEVQWGILTCFSSCIIPWWAAHLCLSEAQWKLKTWRSGTSALSFPGWNNTLIGLSAWKKNCPSPITSVWQIWWENHPRSDISKSSLSYLYLLMKRTANVICRTRILQIIVLNV